MRGKPKRIYDEVHGYINFSDLEMKLIDNPYMQRLKYIKQLSAAFHVYPGATHTRFSHSIGTMHIMSVMTENLRKQGFLEKDEAQLLRLAALLHDIGHYPYSHAIEDVYQQLYPGKTLSHEELGEQVITRVPEVRETIEEAGYNPEEVAKVVLKKHKNKLYNQLMGSDIDVDKIDYLLRDSKHTGVAYGNIDVQRITQTVTVDDEGNLAVLSKGLEAVENLYVGRLHMYRSVYLHKTVVSLEIILKQLYKSIHEELESTSKTLEFREIINPTSRAFTYFNDNYVTTLIYTYALKSRSLKVKTLAEMYIFRRPLKLAYETYSLTVEHRRYESLKKLLESKREIEDLALKSGLESEWIFPYTLEVEVVGRDGEQARICERPGAPSKTVVEVDSIVKLLPKTYRVARLYCRSDKVRELAKIVAEKVESTLQQQYYSY